MKVFFFLNCFQLGLLQNQAAAKVKRKKNLKAAQVRFPLRGFSPHPIPRFFAAQMAFFKWLELFCHQASI